MNRKPDALLVLALIFGVGIVVSTLTHSNNDPVQHASIYPSSPLIVSH